MNFVIAWGCGGTGVNASLQSGGLCPGSPPIPSAAFSSLPCLRVAGFRTISKVKLAVDAALHISPHIIFLLMVFLGAQNDLLVRTYSPR